MARFSRTSPSPQLPPGKDYSYYRLSVRKDFERCCAYCLRHEDHNGGAENYELDHFKPRKHFPQNTNDFNNIYYSCHRCNKRKSATWPDAGEQLLGCSFVDLCQDEFTTHYNLRLDGTLEPLTKAAKYTVLKMRLNSSELVRQRANILTEGFEIDKPRWR